jgi:plasmid stability protein
MPDVLVRNIDETILLKLKDRAERNGRSLQNELVQVFRSLAEDIPVSDETTAARIKKSLRGRTFSDSAVLIREDRAR